MPRAQGQHLAIQFQVRYFQSEYPHFCNTVLRSGKYKLGGGWLMLASALWRALQPMRANVCAVHQPCPVCRTIIANCHQRSMMKPDTTSFSLQLELHQSHHIRLGHVKRDCGWCARARACTPSCLNKAIQRSHKPLHSPNPSTSRPNLRITPHYLQTPSATRKVTARHFPARGAGESGS